MAQMTPGQKKLAAKSVAQLRSHAEEREIELNRSTSKLAAKSLSDLRKEDTGSLRKEEISMDMAEVALRAARKSRTLELALISTVGDVIDASMTPTAPLRVRNRTPSPKKALQVASPTTLTKEAPPRTFPQPILQEDVFGTISPTTQNGPSSSIQAAMSPRQLPSPPPRLQGTPITAPLSPRPHGPRSPGPRSQPQMMGIGSARTTLRIVSGQGRRVSPGREMIPLKGDENDSPVAGSLPPLHKRQHSEEQLEPRKREPTRSPLQPREDTQDPLAHDPLNVPSVSSKPGSRRSSGARRITPRKSSGPLTPRKASIGTASVASHTSTVVDDTLPSNHKDTMSAISSTKQRVSGERRRGLEADGDIDCRFESHCQEAET